MLLSIFLLKTITQKGSLCHIAGVDAFYDASMELGGILDDSQIFCGHCKSPTKEPYIQCAQCQNVKEKPTVICVSCFSKGAEFGLHENNHRYIVIKNNFTIFNSGWQAKEEVKLINAIIDSGFGNWQDISFRVQKKTAEECREHYHKFYIESPHVELPQLCEQMCTDIVHPQPVTYIGGTDDPPRPLPGTAFCRDMAGYNAARGDFDVEHDHSAELEIQDLDIKLFEDDPKPSVGLKLQMCLLDRYRRRLGERHFRKKLIKDHGLISVSKTLQWMNRYRPFLSPSFADALPKFYGLLNSLEVDLLLEGLKCEAELRKHILDLMEYRRNGIKKQIGIMTYETLKKRREVNMKERRNLVICQKSGDGTNWEVIPSKNVASLRLPIPSTCRRVSVPLDIVGMCGYDKLTEKERQIASEIRLVPEDFLKFKTVFTDECRRSNGLKLAQARTLLKIDVNKIRKIYDHLMSVGLIFPPKRK